MSEALNDVVRVALAHANIDTDLECRKCGIPLLERQAVWADDDTAYCQTHGLEAEQRAIALDKDTEERIGEYEGSGHAGGGL